MLAAITTAAFILFKALQATGKPEEVFEKLHNDYDTKALRIAPNELHISDVHLYKTIYSQTNPFPKFPSFYSVFNVPHSLFAETEPALHTERRKLLNPLFSRAGVNKLEPVILEKIQKMGAEIRRIVGSAEKGSSAAGRLIDVSDMVRCVTVDVISEFTFGQTAGLLGEREHEFGAGFLEAFDIAAVVPYQIHYSAVQRWLGRVIPLEWVGIVDPKFARDSFYAYSKRTTTSSPPVVFDFMKSVPEQLQPAESMDVLVAGSDTTAYTLATGLFHILRRPELKKRLVREVRGALPNGEDLPSFTQLEKSEYLWACVKESLRVAMPVPGMLPRVVPQRPQPFVVDGQVIHPGTVIGMSAYTMHYSTELWGKDAKVFNPDRWLGPDGKHLDSCLCTFRKGSSQCIGINVAHTEATMVMAYLFRNFDLQLKTTEFRHRDVFTQQVMKPGVLVEFSPL
ncbi:Pisatin demethylase [Botryosphaeria dothidea]|uniref:Pisatin demethylase n=1 Tax=Botryosphaeria dothidea TaxID=55169 RepID=A0A8H4IYJ0_9PEZI|nr:Pisatin demethylase [Botryosphaeria dothidea]